MDVMSIGAAIAMTGGAATAANQAAEAANNAANNASSKANAANSAAEAANKAAASYSNLDNDAVIYRTAFNYAYMLMQAELRDVQKRLAVAEAKLNALT